MVIIEETCPEDSIDRKEIEHQYFNKFCEASNLNLHTGFLMVNRNLMEIQKPESTSTPQDSSSIGNQPEGHKIGQMATHRKSINPMRPLSTSPGGSVRLVIVEENCPEDTIDWEEEQQEYIRKDCEGFLTLEIRQSRETSSQVEKTSVLGYSLTLSRIPKSATEMQVQNENPEMDFIPLMMISAHQEDKGRVLDQEKRGISGLRSRMSAQKRSCTTCKIDNNKPRKKTWIFVLTCFDIGTVSSKCNFGKFCHGKISVGWEP